MCMHASRQCMYDILIISPANWKLVSYKAEDVKLRTTAHVLQLQKNKYRLVLLHYYSLHILFCDTS